MSISRHRAKGIQRVDLTYAEVVSNKVARDINRDVVFELIRTKQPISRADLVRLSGLQPSTTSLIAEQLFIEKWITKGAGTHDRRGRPAILLSLNTDMVVIVADIRPNQTIIAVIDLNGRLLSRESLTLGKEPGAGVANIIVGIQHMIVQHPKKVFEGIGISFPGRVDPVTQRLILAPNLPWSHYDLKRAIEKKIPLQVEMDNAANACLLSELWFGKLDGVRNAVLVTISEGVGSAILANGQLVTGKSGLAGEFGHISIDPNGPKCGCGRHGCWEVFASSQAAIGYYAELEPGAARPTIMELLSLAEDNDAAAINALSRQAAYLGKGLRIIASILSPEVILLTGGLTLSWERFGPLVEAELAGHILAGDPPRIAVTSDAELARLRGAAALVLQHHSGYNSLQPKDLNGKPIQRRREQWTGSTGVM